MKISRRKFLQVTGLAAGASMLPLPVKYLGAGKAEAFYQTKNTPLYGTILRLAEIPIAFPNPLGGEFSPVEQTTGFPFTYPKSGMVAGMNFPNSIAGNLTLGAQTGAPVTGVRHFTLTAGQFTDQIIPTKLPATGQPIAGVNNTGAATGMGPTTLWGYKPSLTLLEGLGSLGLTTAQNPYYYNHVNKRQPPLHLGGINFAEGGRTGPGWGMQLTMINSLPTVGIIPNDTTIPGANLGVDRTAVHFHGGIMPWISDGGPFDWFCSTARTSNIVTGESFINNVVLNPAMKDSKTQGEYFWETDHQSARFVWYHDHAWGITRINAYAGVATGLIIRDDFERGMVGDVVGGAYTPFTGDAPAPTLGWPVGLGLPPLLEVSYLDGVLNVLEHKSSTGDWPVREYPLVFQDKIFINGTGATPVKSLDPTWPSTAPQTAGSLWYPHTYERARWARGLSKLLLPSQSVIAEMFGDTMLVNGAASPVLDVEKRRYRFRMLNACNARFLNLQLYVADGSPTGITLDTRPTITNPVSPFNTIPNPNYQNPTNTPFVNASTGTSSWLQIAAEAGFLQYPCARPSNLPINTDPSGFYIDPTKFSLLVGSAERPDVLVDFKNAPIGTEIILYNDCPAPFPGGDVRNDYFPGLNNGNPTNTVGVPTNLALARNTRCIMKFRVAAAASTTESTLGLDTTTDLSARIAPTAWNMEPQLIKVSTLPDPIATGAANGGYDVNTSWGGTGATITTRVWNGTAYALLTTAVNVWKNMSLNETFDDWGRLEQRLGPLSAAPVGYTYVHALDAEDRVKNLDVELWAIYNTTADVHPMHLHMSNWQVVGRQPYTVTQGVYSPTGIMRGANPDETGFKETVKCWPGEITYIIAKWDIPQIDGPSTAPFDPPTSPRPALEGCDETVWHCHILEHEEHDMMRPLAITIAATAVPQLFGNSLAVATTAITGAGFIVGTTSGNTETGTVQSQSPMFGNRTRAGMPVNLVFTPST